MSAEEDSSPFSLPAKRTPDPFDFEAASSEWGGPLRPLGKRRWYTYTVAQLAAGLNQPAHAVADVLKRAQDGEAAARTQVRDLGYILVANEVTTVWCRVQWDEDTSLPTLMIMADLMDTYGKDWF